MVDDEVGHHRALVSEASDVAPRADAGIDSSVIDRVEAGVGTVDRIEEGQDVDAAEHAVQRPVEQIRERREIRRQSIGVGDELCRGHGGVGESPSVRRRKSS